MKNQLKIIKVTIFLVLLEIAMFIKAQEITSREGEVSSDETVVAISEPTPANPAIDEILEFSNITLAIITGRLAAENLPPEYDLVGQKIVLDVEEGLVWCEEQFHLNHLIWQYKICATGQLRQALDEIRLLQLASQQTATSAA